MKRREPYSIDNLPLKPKIRRHLIERQKRSFTAYSERLGIDPKTLEIALYGMIMKELDSLVSQGGIPEEMLQHLRNAPDLWAYKSAQLAEIITESGELIALQSPNLPIDWKSIQQMAREYGLPYPDKSTPESLRAFIESIPHLFVYESEFTGTVKREGELGKIPCISTYELVSVSAEMLIDLRLQRIIQIGKLPASEQAGKRWSDFGSDPIFIKNCKVAIDYALARTESCAIDTNYLVDRSTPELTLGLKLCFAGASRFVLFHEYGHLLMGHFDRPHGHHLEFEADGFAMRVLRDPRMSSNGLEWYLNGALSTLIIFCVMDRIRSQGPSLTHPPSTQRLLAILAQFFIGSAPARNHIESMFGLLKPTVEREYGVKYSTVERKLSGDLLGS